VDGKVFLMRLLGDIEASSKMYAFVRNVLLVWVGVFGSLALSFITQVIMARSLTPNDYGVFFSALTLTLLLATVCGYGLNDYLIKIYGENKKEAERNLGYLLKASMLTVVVFASLLVSWAVWGPHDDNITRLYLCLTPMLISQQLVNIISAKFQASGKFAVYSLLQSLQSIVRLLGAIGLILIVGASTTGFSAVYLIASLVVVLILFPVWIGMSKEISADKQGSSVCGVWLTLKKTSPYGMAILFHLIYFQSSVVLINYLSGSYEAGLYGVAFNIIAAICVLPSVIYQKVLIPRLHAIMAGENWFALEIYKAGNGVMLLIGAIVFVMLVLLSPLFVIAVFGEEYSEAVLLVQLLGLSIPLRFLSSSFGALLYTRDYMSSKVKSMALVAFVNVSIGVALIPSYGGVGAICSVLISEILLAVLYGYIVKRNVYKTGFFEGWFDFKKLFVNEG